MKPLVCAPTTPMKWLYSLALAAVLLSFLHAASAAENAIDVQVFGTVEAAMDRVVKGATNLPAVWSSSESRGAAVRIGRYKDGGNRDCQEVEVSRLKLDSDGGFDEFLQAYCANLTNSTWEMAANRRPGSLGNSARRYIPPKLEAPSVWRVVVSDNFVASASAAYAFALLKEDRTPYRFKQGNSSGVVASVSARNQGGENCRVLVFVRNDNGKQTEDSSTYCHHPTSNSWRYGGIRNIGVDLSKMFADLRTKLAQGEDQALDEARFKSSESVAQRDDSRAGSTRPQDLSAAPSPAKPRTAANESQTATSAQNQEQKRSARNALAAQIPAINIAEQCSANPRGAPWGSSDIGAGTMPKIEEYRAAASHTLRNLKLLYGQMTPEQEDGLGRMWAPFFDNPTTSALAWFQLVNPLLDEYLVTLADLEAIFPGFRDATADVLIASATASQTFFQVSAPVAQVLGQHIEAARKRLVDLGAQIEALGDAPNPLAAKCQAMARHRKAVGSGDIWTLLKKSTYLVAVDGKASADDAIGSAGDMAVMVTFHGSKDELSYAANIADKTPTASLKWNGTKFTYTSQDKYFLAPCTTVNGSRSSQDSSNLEGEISADGRKVLRLRGTAVRRNCKNEKTGDVEISKFDLNVPEAVATLHVEKPSSNSPERFEIYFTGPGVAISSDIDNWKPKPSDVIVRFANFLHRQKPMNMCGMFSGINLMGCTAGARLTGVEAQQCEKAAKDKKVATEKECADKMLAWMNGRQYEPGSTRQADVKVSAGAGDKAKPKAVAPPVDEDAVTLAEAVSHHEALAREYELNAARWAADAAKEKDQKQREELEKRAAERFANASAERDIAASLTKGELVKTRTEWDEKQSQATTAKIRKELDSFSVDNKRLEDIHKVLLMGDGHLSGGMAERISAALKSPNRSQELEKINAEVRSRVRAEKEQNLAFREKEKELADWELERPVAVARGAANAAVMITAIAVPGAGPVAVAWGLGTGYVDGGVKGVAQAGVRMYSPFLDLAAATYEGAEQGGAWGAAKGAGMTLAMNFFMTKAAPKLQNALTQIDPNIPKITVSKRAATEVDVRTAEQRYELAKANARTPEETLRLKKEYATLEQRQAMKKEVSQAVESADKLAAKARREDGTVDTNHPEYKNAVEQLNAETQKIHEKYSAQENRDLIHGETLEAAGLTENDIKLSGGKPKSAASDMDVTASSQKAGKDYVAAMQKKAGVNAVEYGDRWVLSNDVTVWKPTAGAKAGSSAFEAETIYSASKGSDKFATTSGQKYTKGEATGDLQGAVVDNMKKAGEAGLGSKASKDMHVIGKSADKVLEISGADASPQLRKTLADLRNHRPLELSGAVQLGASPAAKAKQTQTFLKETQTAMAKGFRKATETSWNNEKSLIAEQNVARQIGDMKRVTAIQQELAGTRSSNRTALSTVADVAPELVASIQPGATSLPGRAVPDRASLSLSQLLKVDRENEGKSGAPLKGTDPALADLGERCKEAAKRLEAKIKAAKPGSDEASYLTELKGALEKGGKNPAEAIQQVRNVSGHELAVVLKQLGVDSKKP